MARPDKIDDPSPALGISRRTLMRRGAVVGTLMWTAPVVQSLARPAFAAEGTPVPEGHAISFVAVLVACEGGSRFRAKANVEDGMFVWEDDPGPPFDSPCHPAHYRRGEAANGGALGLVVTLVASDPSMATLEVPATLTNDCVVTAVAATAFGGKDCTDATVACEGGCVLTLDL